LVVVTVEVEGFGLGPESADDGAGFVEAGDGWAEVGVRQAVSWVFASGFWWLGA
jgi:hypothetical protein